MAIPDELTTTEVARRLGVKPATVYAYVSRGLLRRRLADDGRTSRFHPGDVERLARRSRHRADSGGGLGVALATSILHLDEVPLRLGGLDPAHLAVTEPFEAVARMLWTGDLDARAMTVDADVVRRSRVILNALPEDTPPLDQLRILAGVASATDHYRADLRPQAVAIAGMRILATFADALPRRGATTPVLTLDHRRFPASIAGRMWPRLTARRPDAVSIRALNAALILLADHELTVATTAVRAAASGRAHPYACVIAGLGAVDGALHGTVARRAHQLFMQCLRPDDAPRLIGDLLRDGARVPGFGHPVHRSGDPRVAPLLEIIQSARVDQRRLAVARAVIEASRARLAVAPNVELALAVLTYTTHMPAGAGDTIYALSSTAGWLAHTLEEYAEPPLRFSGRPTAHTT